MSADVHRLGSETVPATEHMGEITTLTNKIRKDQMHYLLVGPKDRADVLGDLQGDHEDLATQYRFFRPSCATTTPRTCAKASTASPRAT